jgi:hypothetical protein
MDVIAEPFSRHLVGGLQPWAHSCHPKGMSTDHPTTGGGHSLLNPTVIRSSLWYAPSFYCEIR